MKRRHSGFEDMCPVCGHLVSKKPYDCPFCGSNLQDFSASDIELFSWEDLSASHDVSNQLGGTGWHIVNA
jgi:hypothetical protein